MASMIAQISPLALIDSRDKLILAIAFSILALIAFLFWLFPPTLWFEEHVGGGCPLCESKDVRPSQAVGLRDQVGLLFNRRPYRCRSCRARFPVRVAKQNLPAAPPAAEETGDQKPPGVAAR
jgi:hypothetical protein